MASHIVARSNEKGEKFVGHCLLCGKQGLSVRDSLLETCTKASDLTQEKRILLALEGQGVKDKSNGTS